MTTFVKLVDRQMAGNANIFGLCGRLRPALGGDDLGEGSFESGRIFIGAERPSGCDEPLGLLLINVFSAFSFW
jgi:hypothetical protein